MGVYMYLVVVRGAADGGGSPVVNTEEAVGFGSGLVSVFPAHAAAF